MALIYFTTAWCKIDGHLWMNGTATWYTARLGEFERFAYPAFIRDVPFVYFSTYGTLLIEFSLATLVFVRPLRNCVLLAGLLLHAFIDYSMNIPMFGPLMVSLYISHITGEEWSAFRARVEDLPVLTLASRD